MNFNSIVFVVITVVACLISGCAAWTAKGREAHAEAREEYIEIRAKVRTVFALYDGLAGQVSEMADKYPEIKEIYKKHLKDKLPEQINKQFVELDKKLPETYEDMKEFDKTVRKLIKLTRDFDENMKEIDELAEKSMNASDRIRETMLLFGEVTGELLKQFVE